MNEIKIVAPPGRPGTLAAIAKTLSQHSINITQCKAMEDEWQGLILLSAEPHDDAVRVLSEAGYLSVDDDLLLLRIPDAPGQLAAVTAELMESNINILSMRFLSRNEGQAIVVMSTDNNSACRSLLKGHLLDTDSQ